jgi:hypothetical protein
MSGLDSTGRTVVGLFPDRRRAEAAIRDLKASGFPDDSIGLAMQDPASDRPAADTGDPPADAAATGAVSGGVVGGLIGLLGSLLVPGLGPSVVGGVLASTLAGAGIGAATGGLIGALMAVGVPEEDARHFDRGLRSGGALVTVSAGARTGEALAILQRHEVDLGPGGPARYQVDRRTEDSSTGNRGMPSRGAYRGVERRSVADPTYNGPERRLVGV